MPEYDPLGNPKTDLATILSECHIRIDKEPLIKFQDAIKEGMKNLNEIGKELNENMKRVAEATIISLGVAQFPVLIGYVNDAVKYEEAQKELEKLKEEHKQLLDSIKNGCDVSGTTKDAKIVRQFRNVTRMKVTDNEKKLPKKFRNGWR